MSVAYAPHPDSASRQWRRVTPRERCPICQHPDWCRTFADGGVECMRISSATSTRNGGWLHWPHGRPDDWQSRLAALPPPPPRPLVDRDLADRAYRALLARCPLTEADRARLHARGLTDDAIARHGYGTLPDDSGARQALAAHVQAAVGHRLAGAVPGFVETTGRLTIAATAGGLLIPTKDAQGRYAGVRLRLAQATGGGKYRWLSAGDIPGASLGQDGTTVHVAEPPELAPTVADTVFLVEGELKANVTADRLYHRSLGIPGVSSIGQVVSTLEAVGGITTVIVAFDQDKHTNPHVAAAEAALARLLAAAGYTVLEATWSPAAGKGLDDILTSTPPRLPFARPHPALADVAAPPATDTIDDLAELKRFQALWAQAHRSPNLGNERHTLVALATSLAHAQDEAWVPMPYARIGDQAGISGRTAEHHLQRVGVRPSAGEAGLLDGLIEVGVRTVPERAHPTTGEITGGYEALHVRRLAPVTDILARIATAPVPAAGKRNNHGGARTPCPRCGETTIERTITDRCAGCGELLKHTVRVLTGDADDGAAETPGDKMTPTPQPDEDHPVVDETTPPVDVHKGPFLSPTPPRQDDVRGPSLREVARAKSRERLDWARADLTTRALAPPPEPSPAGEDDEDDEARASAILTLFQLDDTAECQGCGAIVDAGSRWCFACDPRGA